MNYSYNKDEIKNNLTNEQIIDFLNDFHAEPEERNGVIVARTVCHNNCGCGSHKLYYYPNTTLFKCYTDCGTTFDIFELAQKILSREQPKSRDNGEWNLPESIDYVARKFGYAPNYQTFENKVDIEDDLKLLDKYERINDININTQEVELKEYDGNFLAHLPHPTISTWIKEGITKEVMQQHGICYDPKNCGIVIPHYDINNRLIGIRERTLIKEQAEQYGKYMPARIGGKMFNHPLSFSVYNLNYSKENIQKIKKAIIFESEKSCLKYASYFGTENDISCAVCGCNLLNYQFHLIFSLGIDELIIGFDKQFKEIGDNEYIKWVAKLKNISNKFSSYCNISFLFDIKNLLDYKDAPVDKGDKVFLQLFKERLDSHGR